MPITTSDIKFLLSTKSGAAGYTEAQADPNASLGKYCSTTPWAGGVLHDLFNKVTGAENAASTSEYRCVFIWNDHATLTAEGVVLWISAQTPLGVDFTVGLDTTATSDKAQVAAQALEVADVSTAPVGVTFSAPATEGAGLVIGDLAPGEVKAIWIKWTAADRAALDNDSCTLSYSLDTAA